MKRILSFILVLGMLLTAGAAFAEDASADPTLAEGYTEEKDGYIMQVRYCMNAEKRIFGRFFYPEGFDPAESYPVVIMSHGLGSTADLLERGGWASAVTAQGYVGYAFDFCGGSPLSRSDGDYMQMSVRTEQSDLSAVMDFVKAQPFTDAQSLFLLGQSQGGFVTAITAAARPDEVKAAVLLYPALCLVDDLHAVLPSLDELNGETFQSVRGEMGAVFARDAYDIDVMEEISHYKGNVLLIHGINDTIVPYSYSARALTEAYAGSNSELLLLSGKKAVHSFEMAFPQGRDYAQEQTMAFLKLQLGQSN